MGFLIDIQFIRNWSTIRLLKKKWLYVSYVVHDVSQQLRNVSILGA